MKVQASTDSCRDNTLDRIDLSIDLESSDIASQGNLTGEASKPQSPGRPQNPLAVWSATDRGASVETDSSNLGATASLNEDSLGQATASHSLGALVKDPSLDESPSASSIIKELESQAKRLVSELTNNDDEAALEDATEQLESALESATDDNAYDCSADREAAVDSSALLPALNEEEQRIIELESDDIERRDPKGQASEQRAKSPQLSTELSAEEGAADAAAAQIKVDNLTIEPLEELLASGRSSPALNSSRGGSSSEGEGSDKGDDGNGNERNDPQQQGQEQKQAQGKNRKRNRNKKKGKK